MSERRQTLTTNELRLQLERRKTELAKLERTELLTGELAISLVKLNSQLDQLGGKDGTAGEITTVTQNWVQIVRSISLAANSMAIYTPEDFNDPNDDIEKKPITERLVRIPVKDGVISQD